MTRINEIKARLEAATPGPWQLCEFHDPDTGIKCDAVVRPDLDGISICTSHGLIRDESSMLFIAHAPEDIRYLLARVEELEKNNRELQNGYYGMAREAGYLRT